MILSTLDNETSILQKHLQCASYDTFVYSFEIYLKEHWHGILVRKKSEIQVVNAIWVANELICEILHKTKEEAAMFMSNKLIWIEKRFDLRFHVNVLFT